MGKSKTPPPPEDFEPRFKIEPEPDELLDNYTVRQDTYLWTKKTWKQIGQRYSSMASHKISAEALKALEDGSLDKQAIAAMKDKKKDKKK